MRAKTTIATLFAAVALSTGIGFGISEATQPDPARAGSGKTNRQILGELKKLNRAVGKPFLGSPNMIDLLEDIERNTDQICRGVGEFC